MRVYLFLAFIVLSILHLYYSWKNDRTGRAFTKPLLLPFLFFYYYCSVSDPNRFLMYAFIACWIGDILLMPGGIPLLISGGLSFLLGHIFLILAFSEGVVFYSMPWGFISLLFFSYILYSVYFAFYMKSYCPSYGPPFIIIYLLCNSCMNIFAFMNFISDIDIFGFIGYLGALLFYFSDIVLFLVKFKKGGNIFLQNDFLIMITYLSGLFLIVTKFTYS